MNFINLYLFLLIIPSQANSNSFVSNIDIINFNSMAISYQYNNLTYLYNFVNYFNQVTNFINNNMEFQINFFFTICYKVDYYFLNLQNNYFYLLLLVYYFK